MTDYHIDRQQDTDGNWVYTNPQESSCHIFWQLKYGFNLVGLDDYLEEAGWDTPIAQKNREYLFQRREKALAAQEAHNDDLVEALLSHLYLAIRVGKRLEFLIPSAQLGKKFSAGRKVGTVGPVRAEIRRYLKRSPTARTAEIWSSLESKLPRGWEFFDNRLGRYIETNGPESTSYRRFGNIVSEERKLLAQK